MYEEKHIRTLHKYLKEKISEENKKESHDSEAVDRLLNLQRAIEAIYFNPLLFNDMFEQYDLGDILSYPLEDLPLHINDQGMISETLVKWRLSERI